VAYEWLLSNINRVLLWQPTGKKDSEDEKKYDKGEHPYNGSADAGKEMLARGFGIRRL
jgi:hypothetical protein